MQFDIFGSCISRDPFELSNNNHDVGLYSSRSSLISAMDKKKYQEDVEFDFGSKFKNRILKDDLYKGFKRYVNNPKSEAIIIDLIQERYGVNKHDGGYYTFSDEYKKAKLPWDEIIRFDDHYDLFEEYLKQIAESFSNYKLVIIHEANLCPLYYSENGDIEKLPINKQDEYFMKNGSKYYNLINEVIPNSYKLRLDGFLGIENHRWGPGKAHYEDEYQYKFNEGLNYIINNKKDYLYLNNFGLVKGL